MARNLPGGNAMTSSPPLPAAKPDSTAIPVQLSAQEFAAFILPHLSWFCRKVDSNTLLSTISGIFHARTFQYMV
jgi:hypothetical protein